MKAFSIRIPAGIIALAAIIYILACSPPSANINQNKNTAANSNRPVRDLDACKVQADPAAAAAIILRKLKDEINASDLADGLKPAPNSGVGTFTIDVQQAKGKKYFEAYIKGEVRGDDNLKTLSDILNNFQDESSCLRVVYFVQDLNAPNDPAGFRWSSCQHPKHVCPGGECCEIEPIDTPGATPTPTSAPSPLANPGASVNAK